MDSFNELNDRSVPRINALDRMKFDSLAIYCRAIESTVEDDEEELQEYLDEINQAKDDFCKRLPEIQPSGRRAGQCHY